MSGMLSALLPDAPAATAQTKYDLLKGGQHQGRIAEVSANIDPSKALKTVGASGLRVVPGLMDIRVHVYPGTGQRRSYAGNNTVYPNGHPLRIGVTTVVDVGSSGCRDSPGFKDKVIDRSVTRVPAFLNTVGHGMRANPVEDSLANMDASATAEHATRLQGHGGRHQDGTLHD